MNRFELSRNQPVFSKASIVVNSPSSLLFHNTLDLESLSIKSTNFNAYTFKTLAGVDVYRTFNLSRHMLLSRNAGRHMLELFALPCIFRDSSQSLQSAGITADLMQEMQESYSILFNAWATPPLHAKLGRVVALRRRYWCRACAAYQMTNEKIETLKLSTTKRNDAILTQLPIHASRGTL